MSRGRSEVYLKDQAGARRLPDRGGARGGGAAARRRARCWPAPTSRGWSRRRARCARRWRPSRRTIRGTILEQAAIAGALVPGVLDDDPQGTADRVAARLDLIAAGIRARLAGAADPGRRPAAVADAARRRRGAGARRLRAALGRGAAAGGADRRRCRRSTARTATLVRKDREQAIFAPTELLDAVTREGEKGLALQRYKGLGEMNPEQLWETTLDPEARTLLQVRVDQVDEADEVFTKLMGDEVEPRREFIQTNALSVENLDF